MNTSSTPSILLPEPLRPYEKLERYGLSALTDEELLAVVLRCGTREKPVYTLSYELLHGSDGEEGLIRLMHMQEEDLLHYPGIGRVKAMQLSCLIELSKRMWRVCSERNLCCDEPASVAAYYMEDLRLIPYERVFVMLLDNRNRMMRSVLISQGTLNYSAVSPREIFAEAVRVHAASVIIVHNHPSGVAEPSKEDFDFALRLREAGELMDIPLWDFMIIGDNTYVSFREKGLLS